MLFFIIFLIFFVCLLVVLFYFTVREQKRMYDIYGKRNEKYEDFCNRFYTKWL